MADDLDDNNIIVELSSVLYPVSGVSLDGNTGLI